MNMSIDEVARLSRTYKLAMGSDVLTVHPSGLEPTLWWARPSLTVCDMVYELTKRGFRAEMTTSGGRLWKLSRGLADAGLARCRVSIHSLDPKIYYQITGADSLLAILDGVDACREAGTEVAVNTTLLRGFTDDIPKVLDLISERNLTLKLYDLWWVPRISSSWAQFYIHWSEVVLEYVEPITQKATVTRSEFHRERREYQLAPGGVVVVKAFDESMPHKIEIPEVPGQTELQRDFLGLRPCFPQRSYDFR